ncbi:MAG TPA: hypothetical protein VJ201_04410 [Candidatus Babeliales bacterium]|nr:hypothetical protein [Candidatus Babeliales bacterium]
MSRWPNIGFLTNIKIYLGDIGPMEGDSGKIIPNLGDATAIVFYAEQL